MSRSSLNLQQLSNFLHLPDAKIRKLVDKGAIPSRRVNGELVFSQDEVHRWLEHRIGSSGEEELVQVEEALEKSVPAGTFDEAFDLVSLIPEGAIALPLLARTRDSVIRSMVQLAASTGLLWDTDAMSEAVKAREELHTTALDNGVALLHPRRPMPSILGDSCLALGIVPSGVPFGGPRNGYGSGLTDIFFLICSMDDRIHLRILTRLSRVLTHPDFLFRLRGMEEESLVRELILETEGAISSVG
ncbi:MAG: PTS sugar transporter subunit IIA [Planctomycetaceae bacterium]|nr:PTS sugar transporter subunit IIA [Planctomycetaceae bacterium]